MCVSRNELISSQNKASELERTEKPLHANHDEDELIELELSQLEEPIEVLDDENAPEKINTKICQTSITSLLCPV